MLSFEDDDIVAQRIKEGSNYCDVAHLYVATYGVCQVILQELSPINLDGNGRLTICANVENGMMICPVAPTVVNHPSTRPVGTATHSA